MSYTSPRAYLVMRGRSAHVDPSKFSWEELAHVRGSMWTARWNDPRYGPRPGRPDNILAMVFYQYYHPDERKEMLRVYKDRGYTHAVTGPMVDLGGYHGLYPTTDIRGDQALWDSYLDAMQEWWDAGIIPIHFVHPDGWSIDDMRQLIPYYQQPRAQKLLRFKVWTGWEPTRYDWPNSLWVDFLAQGNEVLPNALPAVHTVADCDALTGGNDNLIPGFTNGTAWQNTAPLLYGWLSQYAGYYERDGRFLDRNSPQWPAQFAEFKTNFGATFQDLSERFVNGKAGWPTRCIANQPLKRWYGEGAAFPSFWANWPEDESRTLGDIAMANRASGYLDGGNVEVS